MKHLIIALSAFMSLGVHAQAIKSTDTKPASLCISMMVGNKNKTTCMNFAQMEPQARDAILELVGDKTGVRTAVIINEQEMQKFREGWGFTINQNQVVDGSGQVLKDRSTYLMTPPNVKQRKESK